MNMYGRDRARVTKCYLDGEVTGTERQQIESWLTTDPDVQHLYARGLKLRPERVTMLVPAVKRWIS
jgi:anti-sigma factor RsiW